MMRRTLTVLAALVAAGLPASAATRHSHQDHFEHYEGTATCLTCHEDEAKAFFHSDHYQWRGPTPDVVNSHGDMHGKLTMVNDFCTSPMPSWIGEVRDGDGKVLASGCSECHAGFGLLPSTEMSREQLENIDCLICHASGYRRAVYQNEDGSWQWRSILWQNQESLDSVSKRISKPTRTMCLRCHSASGGGPNYKRGDLEYALVEPDRDFDVHMSPDGADLHCVDCHAGQDHRVVGRGVDLAATDSPGQRLNCDNGECHDSEPHPQELLNRHLARVNCTVCHIPTYAQEEATDMYRDWSDIHFSVEKGKHIYKAKFDTDVIPVYAWYDGTSRIQLPRQAVAKDADGNVMMAIPQGSKDDPNSRIHTFKVHRARLPVLEDKGWLLPISVYELYAHGDIDRAVKQAAESMYDIHDAEFEWVDTVRYMSISHEVRPAENALRCLDCHGPDGRLDWAALGYDKDPLGNALSPTQ